MNVASFLFSLQFRLGFNSSFLFKGFGWVGGSEGHRADFGQFIRNHPKFVLAVASCILINVEYKYLNLIANSFLFSNFFFFKFFVLSGTQYLFLSPNRYIFHGAEVFSDSDDDLSSSSCGTNSDSESLQSPGLQEPAEDDSEIEDFYPIKYDNDHDSDTENRAAFEEEPEAAVIYENNEILGDDNTVTKL